MVRQRAQSADRKGSREAVEQVEGVRLTHPDKVLFPDQGLRKRDLAAHYRTVVDWMLPHVADRPLTLLRCPDGQHAQCFYQKHASGSRPDAIHTLEIREQKKTDTYMYVTDLAGLVGLVQIGVLEVHLWGSRRDRVDRPDRVVFDLDPGEGVGFARVMDGARLVRDRLDDLGLESFVMTTGGKGLHVVMHVDRRHGFDEILEFAKAVAKSIEREGPDTYIAEASKEKRKGKVFVDYLRNTRGGTAICPYSTRARPGAPVATPVRWEELGEDLKPDQFTAGNIGDRLARLRTDPWKWYGEEHQRITASMRRKLAMGD